MDLHRNYILTFIKYFYGYVLGIILIFINLIFSQRYCGVNLFQLNQSNIVPIMLNIVINSGTLYTLFKLDPYYHEVAFADISSNKSPAVELVVNAVTHDSYTIMYFFNILSYYYNGYQIYQTVQFIGLFHTPIPFNSRTIFYFVLFVFTIVGSYVAFYFNLVLKCMTNVSFDNLLRVSSSYFTYLQQFYVWVIIHYCKYCTVKQLEMLCRAIKTGNANVGKSSACFLELLTHWKRII